MSNNSTVFAQWTASISRSPKAAFTAFSAPMALARRRCCELCSELSIQDAKARARCLGSDRPITQSRNVGYLPEERGLYQSMRAVGYHRLHGRTSGNAAEGSRQPRAASLLEEAGLDYAADRQIRQLSKGMAQTVQLMGTIVHEPKANRARRALLRPRCAESGQARKAMIRAQAAKGVTSHFLHPCHRPCRAACANGSRSSPRARSASTG